MANHPEQSDTPDDPVVTTAGSGGGATRRVGLVGEDVIGAAVRLVESEGPDALTMRRLATELGVTTPTIYWHVGSREELVNTLMRTKANQVAAREIVGDTPHQRIMSAVGHMWEAALQNRALTLLGHRTGTTSVLRHELDTALLGELEAAGLSGSRAADAFNTILFTLTGFLVFALRGDASDSFDGKPWLLWADDDQAMAAETLEALTQPPDTKELFNSAISQIVKSHLQPP